MNRYHVMLIDRPAEVTGIPLETVQAARVGDVFTLSGGPGDEDVCFDIVAIDDTDPAHVIVWVAPHTKPAPIVGKGTALTPTMWNEIVKERLREFMGIGVLAPKMQTRMLDGVIVTTITPPAIPVVVRQVGGDNHAEELERSINDREARMMADDDKAP